jgi:hypothetical protein
MSKKNDRQLRLKRLTEREIDPKDLANVTGGAAHVTRPGNSRYCALSENDA